MFVFALVFSALAALGAAIGIGHVGHPIGGQSVESYGWGLFINGAALAAFFALRAALARSDRKTNRSPRLARAVAPAQAACAIAEERTPGAPKSAVDLGTTRAASLASEPPQATVVLPDDPEAILDVLIERVGMAGVDLMLRNRARFADAAE